MRRWHKVMSAPRTVQSCLPISSLPSCPCFSGLTISAAQSLAVQVTFNKALWKLVWPFPFRYHLSVTQDLHWGTWVLNLENTWVEIFFSWWGILPFFFFSSYCNFCHDQRDLEFWQIAWRNWESLFLITVLDWAAPKVLWNTAVGSQQEAQPSSASKTQVFLPILGLQNFLILQLKILLQLLHLFKAFFFFFLIAAWDTLDTQPLLSSSACRICMRKWQKENKRCSLIKP